MHKNHFERLLELLEIERVAEREENKRELERFPVAMREARGKTVSKLLVQDLSQGLGGMSLLTLERSRGGEDLAPFHAMNQGDLVLVTFPEGSGFKAQDGVLYKVQEYQATVALSEGIPEDAPKGSYRLDLVGSDATYQRMRKALATVQKAEKKPVATLRDIALGVEEPSPLKDRKKFEDLTFFDSSLNEYQQEAVKKALAAQEVAVIHGPPGTGKTTVLVEIIRQAAAQGQRVLASAPSNIAVDNMVEKLLPAELRLVRLGHPARIMESLHHTTLDAQIQEHPFQETLNDLYQTRERLIVQTSRADLRGLGLSGDERRALHAQINDLWRQANDLEYATMRQIIQGADVVLATHGGLGKMVAKEKFDLVIMDEASQATEPMSWIPLCQGKKAVFAGDPLQLPPTIYSDEAAKGGLAVTLFERFQSKLPEDLQALLRIQYRMHETIMGFSSQEFYKGKLEAHESVKSHTAQELPGVQSTDLTEGPLVFIDTSGAGFDEVWNELMDSRENPGEAGLLQTILNKLKEAGVPMEKTGVLAPYLAQVKLLKTQIKEPGLEIASIDGFQGREKEVILISLVRSNPKGEVGFLSDTRRMNVALTRARRLLIVIGDSATIAQHPFFERFVTYADTKGTHRSAYEWGV